MNFTIITADQRSPEWFAARAGRLTGSVASEMLAKIKSGEAAGRRNLRLRLVLERLTGKPQESSFVSGAMQQGIEREADAFAAYEALTGNVVQRVGFLAHRELMAGCSPDGHFDNFGRLLSIKCRQPAAHLEFLKSGTVPGDAYAQIRHELWVTGATEHIYFSWSPDFPEALQSRAVTISREQALVGDYDREARKFLAEVDTELAALQTLTNLREQLTAVQGAA